MELELCDYAGGHDWGWYDCRICNGGGQVEKMLATDYGDPFFVTVLCPNCDGHRGSWRCVMCGEPKPWVPDEEA